MTLVEVRFKGNRKAYFTWEESDDLAPGQEVIVSVDRGEDLGLVSAVGDLAAKKCGVGCSGCALTAPKAPDGAVVRRASTEDTHLARELRKAEDDIRRKVIERVSAHQLTMKVSDTEWQWDRRKLTIYFTAETRVDFRTLVRDLASLFRTRIELRQIGARDEAKRLEGVGRCGREYCCSSWLPELRPVSLSLAKDQRLSLNPSQISGGCGRLLCCLRYEHEFYVQSRKRFPKEGKVLTTARGLEKVQSVDIFRERILLRAEDGSTRTAALADLRTEVVESPPAPGIARGEHVAQRLAVCLERRRARIAPRFADAVVRDRARRDHILGLVRRIGETCERRGIPHVFLKLAQHYPDVGRDVDLLLGVPSPATDGVVLDQVSAIPGRRRLGSRLAGTTAYPLPDCGTVLDVHHGRLGPLGEFGRCAGVVLRRRRSVKLGSVTCSTPSAEDQMLLQALAQSSGRRSLRLCDVYWTIATLRARALDWATLIPAAEATGLLPGLSCHLEYVEQIHDEVFRRPLLETGVRGRLGRSRWGRVRFLPDGFRLPVARVTARLYLHRLRAELAAGDWEAAGRLCLVPLTAVAAWWRRAVAR